MFCYNAHDDLSDAVHCAQLLLVKLNQAPTIMLTLLYARLTNQACSPLAVVMLLLLLQAHELSEQLQQEVTDAQAQLATAQTQLGDSKSAHAESQQQLSASQSSITSLQTQLDKLKQELTQSQQAAPAAAAAHQESDSAASSAAASMSLQLSDSQQHVSSLQQQLEQLRMQLEDSQQAAAQAESVYKDACAAAASYAHQQLVDSQQQVTLLQSERDQIRQQLLQLQETAAQAAAAQHSKDAGANATAVSSSLLDDAPTVAPPTNASAESQGSKHSGSHSPSSIVNTIQKLCVHETFHTKHANKLHLSSLLVSWSIVLVGCVAMSSSLLLSAMTCLLILCFAVSLACCSEKNPSFTCFATNVAGGSDC